MGGVGVGGDLFRGRFLQFTSLPLLLWAIWNVHTVRDTTIASMKDGAMYVGVCRCVRSCGLPPPLHFLLRHCEKVPVGHSW